ncbi:MAG: hypothetical protein GF317_01665 [Candidatus Lokiarchaeota archaeon]|nr:hypothetical protein [Candidatus Lokiarchaeota archaeon]
MSKIEVIKKRLGNNQYILRISPYCLSKNENRTIRCTSCNKRISKNDSFNIDYPSWLPVCIKCNSGLAPDIFYQKGKRYEVSQREDHEYDILILLHSEKQVNQLFDYINANVGRQNE